MIFLVRSIMRKEMASSSLADDGDLQSCECPLVTGRGVAESAANELPPE
jgi:hypothetical protein